MSTLHETKVDNSAQGGRTGKRRVFVDRSRGRAASGVTRFPHSPKMHLAQELVDYIIDFLQDDQADLIRVSLVSRAWVGRARTYLCESLKITSRKLSSLNPSYLTPLCGYVKTLYLVWPRNLTDPPAVLDCFELSELHTLVVHSCELPILSEQTVRRCFAKFPRASITTLELRDISLAHRTPLVLLSIFPNVDNLMISVDRWWPETPISYPMGNDRFEAIQRISLPRLRGCFTFLDAPGQGVSGFHSTLRTIAAFPPQFQTVSLKTKEQSWEEILEFLSSCSQTVRKVYIGLAHRKPRPCVVSPVPRAERATV